MVATAMIRERLPQTHVGGRPRTLPHYVCLILVGGLLLMTLWCVRIAHAAPVRDVKALTLVSLGPTVTEKLYLLGVQDRLLGVTTYCTRPPEARSKEKVGSVTQVSIEKILDLKPDLVFATSLTEPRAIRSLRELKLAVTVFDEPASFAEMNDEFIKLGQLVGEEDRAREIVRAAERKVATISRKVRGLEKPKVFIQIGSKPLFTATRDSVMNDMVELAGATNIGAQFRTGLFSREEVLSLNPDVILIVEMGITAENEKRTWQRFSKMAAVRNNRIFILDPYETCSPTPVTFVDALETIVEAVHPGLEVKK
ncbi:MAG TPA: helical backbone metal receptor [Syntrophorhabdaceae bacterium]|nr:helical backbone metal receptor [Syntrophorhabdaceae bacterium]